MIKFKLNDQFKKRFENFLSSELFFNQPEHSKTDYWRYHSKQIKYSINKSTVTLMGKSGNYIPEKKNSPTFFLKSAKTFIKRLIGLEKSNKLSYQSAFEKIMNIESDNLFEKLKIDKKKIIAQSFSECKKQFPFNYEVNEQIIKSYYHINILNSYIELSKTKFIAEIGAGNGNLMALLKYHFKTKCIINIDLPETLTLCIPFLENLFPDAQILLPNEIGQKISKNDLLSYDFIFLTPSQIDILEENLVELFINTDSFAEMNMSQIKEYINLIQKVSIKDSFFFCCNRLEKKSNSVSEGQNFENMKPIKFSDYPFLNNEILFSEICKFHSLVQKDLLYLRLEKIKK